jgi:hypothetical protein
MVRFGKPIGFAVGLMLGVSTRDYFVYPYAIRVIDLEDDFKQYEQEALKAERQVERIIRGMTARFD